MSVTEAERLARAALSRLAEPNDPLLAARVSRLGATGVLAAIRAGDPEIVGVEHYRSRLAGLDPAVDLERAAAVGARLVCPGDAEWPTQLDDLDRVEPRPSEPSAAPLALWVRGDTDLRLGVLRSLALVGSRAATGYGLHVASELASGLADRGWSVVSGGAYGIDAAAHRGALAAGGLTVAVLACGIDMAYPRGHEALLTRIAGEGLVVSELPPGCHPTKGRFLDRNRLIAALCRGTVVVEAALRSGALNTAAWARRLNRVQAGVPGPVTSALSAGVHREIRERGALLVTGASDVVAAVGTLSDALAEVPEAADPATGRRTDGLDPVSLRVLDALPVRRGSPEDKLAQTCGLAPQLVRQRLGLLEAMGVAQRTEAGWRLAAHATSAGSAAAVPHSPSGRGGP